MTSSRTMNITIPQPVIDIYNTLEAAGHEVYLVGGSVRNMLLNKPVKDWDLTTDATPEEILKLFPEGFYDNQFGTVGISISSQFSVLSSQKKVNQSSDNQSDKLKTEKLSSEN